MDQAAKFGKSPYSFSVAACIHAATLAAIFSGCGFSSPATTNAADAAAATRAPLEVRLGESFVVAADAKPRPWSIESARLATPDALPKDVQLLLLRAAGDEQQVPCQVDRTAQGGARLWWLLDRKRDGDGPWRLELRAGRGDVRGPPPLEVQQDERRLVVRRGNRSLLQYNMAHASPPPPLDPRYGRSAHLHPVWTPSGRVVTDEFPPDHAHQSGVFLAYTKTRFEGREPNFWELANNKGRVRFAELQQVEAGPVYAQFVVRQEHVDETAPSGGKVALMETWRVQVWNIDPTHRPVTLWDIESTLECAGASPLELPTYHYGGMALRGARDWSGPKATFVTSEGQDRIAGNHTRPQWCDLGGLVDGQTAGLAIFTHPANFRYPEPLRIHPTMPYMVYAPSHLGDWKIVPGTPHVSRYRFAAHDGPLAAEDAAHMAADFQSRR